MESLLITPKTQAELQKVIELLQSTNVSIRRLTDADKEEFGLASMMKETDRTATVTRASIMNKLKN
jgi:hypothetical protein